jgi:sugar transferase (PEP-CTERM/EpsH1 system associated)
VSSARRPIKVLHILHAFSHGGLENGIVNIINGSPPDIEHELCLLTTADEFIDRLRKPVRSYQLRKRPGNSLRTILDLRRFIRQSGANIVHTRNWGAFDGVIAACLCPGIALLHGEHGRDISDTQGRNRRRNLLRCLFSARVSRFTTVSEDLQLWLSERVGIPKRKIVLIRNGVDLELYRPRRDIELRRELGVSEQEFVVGAVGRLDPVKNYAGLIRSFAALAKEFQDCRLLIVGDGPERQALETLIRDLGMNPLSILKGYRSDVDRFYGVFDVFVLNSYAEGMSNTLLEAMASGLPIIATSVGASADLISDGNRGKLIATGDEAQLTTALRDYRISATLRHRHALEARCYVEQNCSLSQMVTRYVDLYLSISRLIKT